MHNAMRYFSARRKPKYYAEKEDPMAPYNKWFYKNILDGNNMILFYQYNNIKINQLNALRYELLGKDINTKYIISKQFREMLNPDHPENPLNTFFSGAVVAFYTNKEPEEMLDLINRLQRGKSLLFIGGIFEGKLFSHEILKEIAERVRSAAFIRFQLLETLNGNSNAFVHCLQNTGDQLIHALSSFKE